MYRARIALPVLLGGIIALWGCTPPPNATNFDKSLEQRVAKLEKELKAAKDEVSALTSQLRLEQGKSRTVAQERDDARSALKARDEELSRANEDLGKANGELNRTHGELMTVRNGLKELLGRVEAVVAPDAKPTGASVSVSRVFEKK